MEDQTITLPNKMHALMMRVCTAKNLTPSELMAKAMQREIKAQLPLAKLIIKKAKELGITKGGSK